MASSRLINEILSALNNKLTVGGIFCDLEKASDCINHNTLLSKLEFYGIEGKFNALNTSYLKDRYQKVETDNMKTHNSTSSRWKIVKHGILQGSILGRLFLLLYVNDLLTVSNSNARTILYADNTSVIVSNPSHRDFELNMNKATVDINEWFKTNMLSLS
jgi:hypothetical protein